MIPGLALPGVLSTLFYLFFHGRTGALNQYLVVPLGFDPVNWMMDPFLSCPRLLCRRFGDGLGWLLYSFFVDWKAIPRWQWEVAKLRVGWEKVGKIFIPNLWHLALFAMVFLVVDGFASFLGAYNLLGWFGRNIGCRSFTW